MQSLLFLLIHCLATLAKLLGPGGLKAVLAENLLIKHQLLVLNRVRQRAPALSLGDRLFLGFWATFLKPQRLLRAAVVIKPATLLRFHQALITRKYHLLFSSRRRGKSGPPAFGRVDRRHRGDQTAQSPVWLPADRADHF